MNYLALLILIGLVALMIWGLRSTLRQSKKDWATLHDLEERAEKIKTKEETEALHAELVKKGNKIFNEYVIARLNILDGYLRGMYKQFKEK